MSLLLIPEKDLHDIIKNQLESIDIEGIGLTESDVCFHLECIFEEIQRRYI